MQVLIKEIMQRRRACTFFHWEYPKEVDSCQKSNLISPQRIAFFNASENLRWFGELFAQTQSLSSLVLKNVSLKGLGRFFFWILRAKTVFARLFFERRFLHEFLSYTYDFFSRKKVRKYILKSKSFLPHQKVFPPFSEVF